MYFTYLEFYLQIIMLFIAEIAHIFGFTLPKIVFCDSSSIENVRLALQMLQMDSTTQLVTIDIKVSEFYTVKELLEPFGDEELFV